MENNGNKLEKLNDTVQDLKVQMARQEVNFERLNEILARLTESVEIHVKRSDNLEELVTLFKQDLDDKLNKDKEESISNLHAELLPIKSHISFVKGAIWMIGAVIGLMALLHQFGLLKF